MILTDLMDQGGSDGKKLKMKWNSVWALGFRDNEKSNGKEHVK